MDERRIVGENVARLRAAKGVSQTKLAASLGHKKLGITQGYISELEAGLKNPTLTTLVAIADALDIDMAELFTGLHNREDNARNSA